jgi:hypothetical protein
MMIRTKGNFREIGERPATAFRLSTRPPAVYGSRLCRQEPSIFRK